MASADALRLEDLGLERRRGERHDLQAGRMGRGELGEGLARAAVGLVAPAVDDGPHGVDAERSGDVTGHRVGVDEQDGLALVDLEGAGEVRRDGRLADAALRIEDGDDRRAPGPAVGLDRSALEDRPAAVVDGLAADEHRLDAPAERLGGVGPGEVLVLDGTTHRLAGQPIEGARRDDHERRDGAAALAQERVVLERLVEVGLAVQDGDADVATIHQEGFELLRLRDRDDLESGRAQLSGDGRRLLGR